MITKISSGQYGVVTYLIDTDEEFINLSTKDGVGSTALSPTGTIYILNGSKKWVKFGEDGDNNA